MGRPETALSSIDERTGARVTYEYVEHRARYTDHHPLDHHVRPVLSRNERELSALGLFAALSNSHRNCPNAD